jgi:hypothetical protein
MNTVDRVRQMETKVQVGTRNIPKINFLDTDIINPLAYTATREAVWAADVLLLILAFCQ